MKAYKGFNKDMTCRGFQYEIGKEYEEEKAEACECGFHACEYPLDCFSYYAPADSKFCEVEQSGDISKDGDDSKVASSIIKIGAEISINGLIKAAYEYIKERCTNHEIGVDCSALTGGNSSALTGGDWSALTGGNRSALTGGNSSALTGGNRSALTGGNCSALTGGNCSALTGGNRSALTGGNRSALTGGNSSALTGGDWSALTGGDRSALTGGYGSALTGGDCSALTGGNCSALTGGDCSALTGGDWSVVYGGENSKVRGGLHSVLVLQYWANFEFKGIKYKVVDGSKIKENTYYRLDDKGNFVEVTDEE